MEGGGAVVQERRMIMLIYVEALVSAYKGGYEERVHPTEL